MADHEYHSALRMAVRSDQLKRCQGKSCLAKTANPVRARLDIAAPESAARSARPVPGRSRCRLAAPTDSRLAGVLAPIRIDGSVCGRRG